MIYPNKNLAWPIAWAAVCLVAEKEGCKLAAYLCSAGVPTLGWGNTLGVRMGMTCTQEQADATFCKRLTDFTNAVKALTGPATPNQLGAMVSLAYNIGMSAFANSSVLRAHKEARLPAAAAAFKLWNKATVDGKLVVLAGLVTRRAAESKLYLA